MGKTALGCCALLALVGFAAPALGEEKFELKIKLTSTDFPNLDTDGKISGATGQQFEFAGDLYLGTSGLEGDPPEGPQGWSCGVRNVEVEILSTTVEGTVSNDVEKGGLEDGGFRVNEIIDPAKNAGKTGMVQALVLSFTQAITLPPNTEQLIAKNVYRATIGATNKTGSVRFEDGLKGKGQPVTNLVTYKGGSETPTFVNKDLSIEGECVPVAEVCNDTIDNDCDNKVDCADEDCAAACVEAVCDDGLDNDNDGKKDCADSDCAAFAKCGPENDPAARCDDDFDNDGDGSVDCADTDCASTPPCNVVPEDCDDGVDNDGDSKIDCADTDCAAFEKCGAENDPAARCEDDFDNDGDGSVDCADSDCNGIPPCQAPDTEFGLAMSADGAVREGNENVKEVSSALGTTFEAIAYVEPVAGKNPEEGPQGWSISVTHDKALLTIGDGKNGMAAPTIVGTDAEALYLGGFKQTEAVDPAKNNGKAGFVSAVVLSLTQAVTLAKDKPQSICKATYQVAGALPESPRTQIYFLDGLRGRGQPVPNVLTVKGDTITAAFQIALAIKPGGGPTPQSKFVRGDANDDGKVNIADPIWIINELVRSGTKTKCQDAADSNDDGLVDLSDAMYLIQWRFLAGPQPLAPFPDCGDDSAKSDTLSCPVDSVEKCKA